jgi:hypothetical protein
MGVKLGLSHERKNRDRVFENRVLRRRFGHKRKKVSGGWRRLHNELHKLYTSPHTVRVIKSWRMKWAGHLALKEEMRNAYNILVRKCEGKRPLRRS